MDTTKDFRAGSEMTSKRSFDMPASDSSGLEKGETVTGFKAWMKKLSVETGGIQRVTDEDRQTNTSKVWNACTF
jgi:hypothetical protein